MGLYLLESFSRHFLISISSGRMWAISFITGLRLTKTLFIKKGGADLGCPRICSPPLQLSWLREGGTQDREGENGQEEPRSLHPREQERSRSCLTDPRPHAAPADI